MEAKLVILTDVVRGRGLKGRGSKGKVSKGKGLKGEGLGEGHV